MNIQDFTKAQLYLIPTKEITLRCIDDRYSEKDVPLANYAVPGAGLGLITDVISGFETVLSLTDKQLETIYLAAHGIIGVPTFHTGKGHDGIVSPVEGCGYCVGTLEGQGHISKQAAAFLKAHAGEIVSEGYEPISFEHPHDASFVLFVDDYNTGVMPTAADGTCAYVVHRTVQKDLLTQITEAAYANLQDEMVVNGVTVASDLIVQAVLAAAENRFGEVAKGLAAKGGLRATEIPAYVVSFEKEPVLVSEQSEEMAA